VTALGLAVLILVFIQAGGRISTRRHLGRTLTNTYAGIAPASAPAFIAAGPNNFDLDFNRPFFAQRAFRHSRLRKGQITSPAPEHNLL